MDRLLSVLTKVWFFWSFFFLGALGGGSGGTGRGKPGLQSGNAPGLEIPLKIIERFLFKFPGDTGHFLEKCGQLSLKPRAQEGCSRVNTRFTMKSPFLRRGIRSHTQTRSASVNPVVVFSPEGGKAFCFLTTRHPFKTYLMFTAPQASDWVWSSRTYTSAEEPKCNRV